MAADTLNILVVDDNPADQIIITEALRDAYSSRAVVKTQDALNPTVQYLKDRPQLDIIFLDLSLPDSLGLNSVLRVHESAPTVPIIVLTGLSDDEVEAQAIHAGAQDYLVKGAVNSYVIGRVIDHAIERQRLMTRLEEFDRLKSQFLATASHEMRTPLTVLRENASLIADEVCGPVSDDQRECLATILRHCDRLGLLLNNLLDLQKIEAGGIHLRRSRTNIASLARQQYTDALQGCRAKDIDLVIDMPDDLPVVLADSDQTTQVLINLLGNAQKFTSSGGTVTIRGQVVAGDAFVKISVSDTGRGIRSEDLDMIFLAFRQSERVDGPGARGTGLGLTITKQIIDMHNGAMTVESEYGKGSTFSFTLPIWDECSELTALLSDRHRELVAKGVPCTMLLIRSTDSADVGMLMHVIDAASRVLRQGDTGMFFTERGFVVYALETDEAGANVVLQRIAREHDVEMNNLDFMIKQLHEVSETMTGILANSFPWSHGTSLVV